MKRITRLRQAGTGRLAVELDGEPWRVLPAEVVLAAGCDVGVPLDRPRARRLCRELRRHEALAVATKALQGRRLSRARLDERLARSGSSRETRREALGALERAGLVDDGEAAAQRARVLSERDSGDALIRWDLERSGYREEARDGAVAALAFEAERAARIVARRGASAATARFLARKGFSAETVEAALPGLVA